MLHGISKAAANAEQHITNLCSEVSTLTEFLTSIRKALSSCKRRSLAFDLVGEELWQQSDVALRDCEATLNELTSFVERLQNARKRAFWKAKVGINLHFHAQKLEGFSVRLRKSNCALQTVLHTITV